MLYIQTVQQLAILRKKKTKTKILGKQAKKRTNAKIKSKIKKFDREHITTQNIQTLN